MPYQPTIGLEIHTELKTRTKMFCDSLNDPDEKHPNINVCPICLGHPGTLPVINKEAVKKVLKTGLALNGEIAEYSEFSRKNYFYPDLPKGYQISQYQYPLIRGGSLEIPFSDKKIRILKKITGYNSESDFFKILTKNKQKLIQELNESKELLQLLNKYSQQNLTPEEKKKVKEQLLDMLRTIPSLAIFLLPGGALILPVLLKIIPKEYLLPSSFRENQE